MTSAQASPASCRPGIRRPGGSTTSTSMGSTASWTTHLMHPDCAHRGVPAGVSEGLSKSNQDIGRRRLIGVGTAGDRRDSDLIELGRVAADFFDVIVIREDKKTTWTRAGRGWHSSIRGSKSRASDEPGNPHHPRRGRGHRVCRVSGQPGDVLAVMGDDMQALTDTLMAHAHMERSQGWGTHGRLLKHPTTGPRRPQHLLGRRSGPPTPAVARPRLYDHVTRVTFGPEGRPGPVARCRSTASKRHPRRACPR